MSFTENLDFDEEVYSILDYCFFVEQECIAYFVKSQQITEEFDIYNPNHEYALTNWLDHDISQNNEILFDFWNLMVKFCGTNIRETTSANHYIKKRWENAFAFQPPEEILLAKLSSKKIVKFWVQTFYNHRITQLIDVKNPFLISILVGVSNFCFEFSDLSYTIKPFRYNEKDFGFGLFVRKKIPTNDFICFYDGLKTNLHPSEGLPSNQQSDYVYNLENADEFKEISESLTHFVDSERFFLPEYAGRWINDSVNTRYNKNAEVQIAYVSETVVKKKGRKKQKSLSLGDIELIDQLVVVAVKDIEVGQQIFIHYGKGYFSTETIVIDKCAFCKPQVTKKLHGKNVFCSRRCASNFHKLTTDKH